MKITIEAETDSEKTALPSPWVRTGCERVAVSGIGEHTDENKTGEFGYLHGDNIALRGDLARLMGSLDAQLLQQASVNGVLQANQMIFNAQRDQSIAQEVLAGRNGLRIHRP